MAARACRSLLLRGGMSRIWGLFPARIYHSFFAPSDMDIFDPESQAAGCAWQRVICNLYGLPGFAAAAEILGQWRSRSAGNL